MTDRLAQPPACVTHYGLAVAALSLGWRWVDGWFRELVRGPGERLVMPVSLNYKAGDVDPAMLFAMQATRFTDVPTREQFIDMARANSPQYSFDVFKGPVLVLAAPYRGLPIESDQMPLPGSRLVRIDHQHGGHACHQKTMLVRELTPRSNWASFLAELERTPPITGDGTLSDILAWRQRLADETKRREPAGAVVPDVNLEHSQLSDAFYPIDYDPAVARMLAIDDLPARFSDWFGPPFNPKALSFVPGVPTDWLLAILTRTSD